MAEPIGESTLFRNRGTDSARLAGFPDAGAAFDVRRGRRQIRGPTPRWPLQHSEQYWTRRPKTFWFPEKTAMAEYGEWNRKGATLSDVTAHKEYGVSRDFILRGIDAGQLEYREGSVWGNPYFRLLRSQLERYVAAELGSDRLNRSKTQTELRKIKKEMASLKKRLAELQARRGELETEMKKQQSE